MNSKKLIAFTLIELLVVIAIVGILSGFVLVSLNSATDSANDARRKSDLSQIVKALLVYNTSNPAYPIETCSIGSTCSATVNNALGQASGITGPNNTYYTYSSINGTSFTVSATMSQGETYSYNSTIGYTQNQGTNWLTGYTYRKSITLNNTGSELTDYQLKFTINRSSGTDNGFTAYVESKCLENYNDIRFTDSSQQPLNYWIESSNSSTATIWVKAPLINGLGDTTIYLYYGNAGASAMSDGNNTFIAYSGVAIESYTSETIINPTI